MRSAHGFRASRGLRGGLPRPAASRRNTYFTVAPGIPVFGYHTFHAVSSQNMKPTAQSDASSTFGTRLTVKSGMNVHGERSFPAVSSQNIAHLN